MDAKFTADIDQGLAELRERQLALLRAYTHEELEVLQAHILARGCRCMSQGDSIGAVIHDLAGGSLLNHRLTLADATEPQA